MGFREPEKLKPKKSNHKPPEPWGEVAAKQSDLVGRIKRT
jgi:hypothetical protein